MDNCTFTNCATRFVFFEKGSDFYPLVTSDMDVMQEIFKAESGSSILQDRIKINIDNVTYLIKSTSIQFYKEAINNDWMLSSHRGQVYNFNIEIWVYVETILDFPPKN